MQSVIFKQTKHNSHYLILANQCLLARTHTIRVPWMTYKAARLITQCSLVTSHDNSGVLIVPRIPKTDINFCVSSIWYSGVPCVFTVLRNDSNRGKTELKRVTDNKYWCTYIIYDVTSIIQNLKKKQQCQNTNMEHISRYKKNQTNTTILTIHRITFRSSVSKQCIIVNHIVEKYLQMSKLHVLEADHAPWSWRHLWSSSRHCNS